MYAIASISFTFLSRLLADYILAHSATASLRLSQFSILTDENVDMFINLAQFRFRNHLSLRNYGNNWKLCTQMLVKWRMKTGLFNCAEILKVKEQIYKKKRYLEHKIVTSIYACVMNKGYHINHTCLLQVISSRFDSINIQCNFFVLIP